MIYLSHPSLLSQYRQPLPGTPYAEPLTTPHDLLLQLPLGSPPTENHTLQVTVTCHSADGLTPLGDVTPAFEYLFFTVGERHYCNLRASVFHPLLLRQRRFTLRIAVSSADEESVSSLLFNGYTEPYWLTDLALPGTTATLPTDANGLPLHLLEGRYDCAALLDGVAYGTPQNPAGGSHPSAFFAYEKRLYLSGQLLRQPPVIARSLAGEGSMEAGGGTRSWLLSTAGVLPQWKADELEALLHAPVIYLNGQRYHCNSQSPLTRLFSGTTDGWKLELLLEDPNPLQTIHTHACTDAVIAYGIPEPPEDGRYYDDAARPIATTLAGLMDWLGDESGFKAVEEIRPVPDAGYHAIIRVEGNGFVNRSFYAGGQTARHRIYGQLLTVEHSDYEALFPGPLCAKPGFATPVTGLMSCAPSVFGEPETGRVPKVPLAATPLNGWMGSVAVTKADGDGLLLSLQLTHSNHPGASSGALTGEALALLSPGARPDGDRFFYGFGSADNSDMTVVSPDGLIRYYGPVTSNDANGISLSLNLLQFPINQNNHGNQ